MVSETYVGLLSAALYLGNVVGSLITPKLFTIFKAKHLIVAAAIFNALAVGVFSITTDYWIIFSSRVLVGFFQVIFVIYFPVWIDLCAPPSK
jgi:predicted MFS family arabinose efflux permease